MMQEDRCDMIIQGIRLVNFRCFDDQSLDLHPQFTLLVGDNGSGKTTFLDALAVAAGVWLVRVPDTTLADSRRPIRREEIRLVWKQEGDRGSFAEVRPASIDAQGSLCGKETHWCRLIRADGETTDENPAIHAIQAISDMYDRVIDGGEQIVLPILAYYGAGRNWLPGEKRGGVPVGRPARRWDAFHDCLSGQITGTDLLAWVQGEYLARVDRQGRWRPGFEAVKRAVLGCIPGADDLSLDWDRQEVVLSIGGLRQPLSNLSAGQQAMLGLVADIAIRAVTQNAFLLPPDELGPEDDPLPRVLRETPGLVLIDELDVHLHPKWQRRVADDLKRTFPAMQFVCTSHSPQVIGQVPSEQIRLLPEKPGDPVRLPSVSLGADSNWILDHEMGEASSRKPETRQCLRELQDAVMEGDLDAATQWLAKTRQTMDGDDGEITRLASSLETLRMLDDEDH